MFVAIWVAGTLLARRGWGLAYAGLLLAEAVALEAALAGARGARRASPVTLLGAVIAILTGAAPEAELAGPSGAHSLPARSAGCSVAC